YYPSNFNHFQIESISQKTMLVTYQLNGNQRTSIWRCHESWSLLFHQITPIAKKQLHHTHYRIVKM
ncbi:TPA: cation-efflux pump, partial [Streptococcus pyogenes]